jgi:SAM-dependent methyltransferase
MVDRMEMEQQSITEIWSPTFPSYACLKDIRRTTTFRDAILATVAPGDIVIEPGAGTGILTFFATEAGAARVYAVEISPVLVDFLRTSVHRNGLADRIVVIAGDATTVPLPSCADVVICELIDTGLMEEMQVDVLNALRQRGVIGPATRIIPERYSTSIELVELDDRFYGFHISGPKHEWPSFTTDATWYQIGVVPLTERGCVAEIDFSDVVPTSVHRTVTLLGRRTGLARALRLSGIAHLAPGIDVGATDTINGDKILDLVDPIAVTAGESLTLEVSYTLGGGLSTLRCVLTGNST